MERKKRSDRRRLKGSLSWVGILLIASAGLRLAGNTGQAVALNTETDIKASPGSGAVQYEILDDEGLRNMLLALQKREADLVEKEDQMRQRLQALQTVDDEVSEKIIELERAEQQLRATLTIAETAAEDDIVRLTLVYENMKPKQAAALFEEMDPNFAAGFLGRMRPDAAAAIMAGLSAEAANLYSVILAGRNAKAPKE